MIIKWLRFVFVHLFIVCALVVSFQEVAQVNALPMPGEPTCRALRPECFPLGSPMREKLTREKMLRDGLKVPDDKIPRLPSDERVPGSKKPICAGLDCPPSNAEKLSK